MSLSPALFERVCAYECISQIVSARALHKRVFLVLLTCARVCIFVSLRVHEPFVFFFSGVCAWVGV